MSKCFTVTAAFLFAKATIANSQKLAAMYTPVRLSSIASFIASF